MKNTSIFQILYFIFCRICRWQRLTFSILLIAGPATYMQAQSTSADITAFSFAEQTSQVLPNSVTQTVNIEVVSGTNVTSLIPVIAVSANATIAPLSGVTQDFTNPVTYAVTAEDGTTTKNWIVTVTVAPNPKTKILAFSFGEQTVLSDINGNVYSTVVIGSQLWMGENLKTTKYNNGIDIPNITDNVLWSNLTTPGYTWYNNNKSLYGNIYGALYNWHVVKTGALCPSGWQIPTVEEWDIMGDFLGGIYLAGSKLKESGNTHWISSNADATNESGFTALPGGWRQPSGVYSELGSSAHLWTSTEIDVIYANRKWLNSGITELSPGGNQKKFGFSCRCMQVPKNKKINIEVYGNADITSLTPIISIPENASISPASGVAQDFTNPVDYTVTSDDGTTTEVWTVTVTEIASPRSIETNITSFSLATQTGTALIDAASHTINIEVLHGTNLTSLVPSFVISSGATAAIGSTVQISGVTANNFTNPVTYTITAEDGITTQAWFITVTVAPPAPMIDWVKQFGSTGSDFGLSIALDDKGNSYATGNFSGTVTFGGYSLNSIGSTDVFVVKINPSGTVLWAKRMGGNGNDFGEDIAVDKNGFSYIIGRYNGPSASFDSFTLPNNGFSDVFIQKLDQEGNVIWVKGINGSYIELAGGIKVDDQGYVYTTGSFNGTVNFGSITLYGLNQDIFIQKMDSYGNVLWAKNYGGDVDEGHSIDLDDQGNIYTIGNFA